MGDDFDFAGLKNILLYVITYIESILWKVFKFNMDHEEGGFIPEASGDNLVDDPEGENFWAKNGFNK